MKLEYFSFHSEISFLKHIVQQNGHPLKIIEKQIFKMLNSLYKPVGQTEIDNYNVPKPLVYFTTYYIGNISEVLSKDIKKLLSESYPQIHLRVLFKSYSTIGSHFKFKDRTPKEYQSNVIYKFTCESCKAFYLVKRR